MRRLIGILGERGSIRTGERGLGGRVGGLRRVLRVKGRLVGVLTGTYMNLLMCSSIVVLPKKEGTFNDGTC